MPGLFAGVALSALALSLLAQPAAAQRFEAQSFALDNGLQIVVAPNHRVPAVTVMVWYRVGAADDPIGRSGIAHFLEHLMFKGTAANPPGTFSAQIARNGGRDNAFTTADFTAYHETVAKDRLDLALRLEADRMTGLVLNDAVVLPERDVILEERRMRIDNEPSALLSEQLRATLYLNAPYRIPTIGWEIEMRQLSTEDALTAYRRWYAPNNAFLVIAGDVATDEVRRLVQQYFGPLAAHPLPERRRSAEPEHRASARLEMKSPRAAQPNLNRSYLAPSYRAGETRHAYPLQVLAEILGGGVESRLHKALVLDQDLALSAGAYYAPSALDLTSFGVQATAKNGVPVAALEAALDKELRRVLEQGVDPEEVKRAVSRMQAASIYARDSLSGPANIIGTGLAIGQSLDDIENWPAFIGQVTAEQVNAAAHAVLIDRNSVTGTMLPERNS